ncbi:MAG: hypothetical protein QOH21_1935 [Acidobacteriota bacterium]|jgi:hypothetical protein|nr:hypothetical protein [Acidobacteriota bacterium]
MSSFPHSPRVVHGGLVLLDPTTAAVLRVIALQYNPDTLTRSLQVQPIGEGDKAEALRIKGPPVETIKLEADLDATDQLEFPDRNRGAVESGVQAQLAALETIVYPTTAQLQANNNLARQGTLELVPMEGPLVLFVWSRWRIVPVRITDFSITEEAFDARLNPIRARVSLGLRVLNVNDFGFDHKGGSLYLTYQRQKERFAAAAQGAMTTTLGIGGIS